MTDNPVSRTLGRDTLEKLGLKNSSDGAVRAVHAIRPVDLGGLLSRTGDLARCLAAANAFQAEPGQVLVIPAFQDGNERVLFGLGTEADTPSAFRSLPVLLPAGDYELLEWPTGLCLEQIALAWSFGRYDFNRYKVACRPLPYLIIRDDVCLDRVLKLAMTASLVRDMINAPPNHMGPAEIEATARDIGNEHSLTIEVIDGDRLKSGFPLVHAVGGAAGCERAPRVVEMSGGDPSHPLVAIIGKGVCFDSGGLNIKAHEPMKLMKKDMGGAAHALGLAKLLVENRLPIRLAVILPLVDNAVGADSYRPGDVIVSRSGLSVEIGHTDAEGRLILADALTRAKELEPDLTIDLATLTGAARIALGPQVVPFFAEDDELAESLARASRAVSDPLWRMPLWAGYADALKSEVADLSNMPAAWAQAGSVMGALFLQRFVPPGPWLHVDLFGWNPIPRPGFPIGAEVQAIWALLAFLQERYQAD